MTTRPQLSPKLRLCLTACTTVCIVGLVIEICQIRSSTYIPSLLSMTAVLSYIFVMYLTTMTVKSRKMLVITLVGLWLSTPLQDGYPGSLWRVIGICFTIIIAVSGYKL